MVLLTSTRFERLIGLRNDVRRGVALLIVMMAAGCVDQDDRGANRAPPEATATTSETGTDDDSAAADGTAAGGAVDDNAALGSAGPQLLSPSAPAVVIEIDRSPEARPTVDVHAVLGEELREHGGKQSVSSANSGSVPAQEVYTADDLRAITAAARESRSEPARPSIYVLVLEGRYENDLVTGVAFAATSFAVFPNQISGGLLGTNRDAFETAVLMHELGHLFGLVDLTGEGAFHEDPQHPGHSNSESSVMYWAVEDIGIADIFRGGPPREFDAADREEMARIRSR